MRAIGDLESVSQYPSLFATPEVKQKDGWAVLFPELLKKQGKNELNLRGLRNTTFQKITISSVPHNPDNFCHVQDGNGRVTRGCGNLNCPD